MHNSNQRRAAVLGCLLAASTVGAVSCGSSSNNGSSSGNNSHPIDPALAAMGKDIFRSDTFGDETFWTDTLMMNQVIQTAVDPMTALGVGLKVDAEALPAEVVT